MHETPAGGSVEAPRGKGCPSLIRPRGHVGSEKLGRWTLSDYLTGPIIKALGLHVSNLSENFLLLSNCPDNSFSAVGPAQTMVGLETLVHDVSQLSKGRGQTQQQQEERQVGVGREEDGKKEGEERRGGGG